MVGNNDGTWQYAGRQLPAPSEGPKARSWFERRHGRAPSTITRQFLIMLSMIQVKYTYPAATLLEVCQQAIRLDAPLQDLMTESNLPAKAMQKPAGHQILSDGELWETTHGYPSASPQDEAATRAPCCSNRISKTVIGTSACDVGLIQRVIVGDVVEMLHSSACQTAQEGTSEGTAYLGSGHHANVRALESMWHKCTKNARLRDHVGVKHSHEFMPSSWEFVLDPFKGGIEVACFVAVMDTIWLVTGEVVQVWMLLTKSLDLCPQALVISIVGKDDTQFVNRPVNVAGSIDSVKHNINWLSACNDNEVNSWDIVTKNAVGWSWHWVADETDSQTPQALSDDRYYNRAVRRRRQ